MDPKVKEALEVVSKLSTKGKEMVAVFLGNPPEMQDAIIHGINGRAPNGKPVLSKKDAVVRKVSDHPEAKKRATIKRKAKAQKKILTKKAKRANGKKPNGKGLPPEIQKASGKTKVRKTALYKADPKGNVTRQAVQNTLKQEGCKEAESTTFKKLVEELEAEGKLKRDRHNWVIS